MPSGIGGAPSVGLRATSRSWVVRRSSVRVPSSWRHHCLPASTTPRPSGCCRSSRLCSRSWSPSHHCEYSWPSRLPRMPMRQSTSSSSVSSFPWPPASSWRLPCCSGARSSPICSARLRTGLGAVAPCPSPWSWPASPRPSRRGPSTRGPSRASGGCVSPRASRRLAGQLAFGVLQRAPSASSSATLRAEVRGRRPAARSTVRRPSIDPVISCRSSLRGALAPGGPSRGS